ncbi:splicing factor u2af-associated 2 [Pyrrhoderma noxium]|uniref:Splicing factor u2af-associated 2 n=1 Tax=Pyrrhoderma noxium TaxID=2282107 RepID=A0A286UH88_9AGAM|nr:splicing factor u2af-associated 2 [Pyrrhoderma noxium]
MDSGAPVAALGASQDAQAAAFAADPRIHFSTVTRRWAFEDDDGNEWEYDANKGAWIQVIDEELLQKQQAVYSVAGVDEETPAAPVLKRQNKKRKVPEDYTSATAIPEAAPAPAPQPRRSKNTAVYVTHLPPDTTSEELVDCFKKFGVLEEDEDHRPKVKLYTQDDGSFSGEALVVYFKEESVRLAIDMLNEAELRLGDASTVMSVSQAQFGHKNEQGGGTAVPSGGGEQKVKKTIDKKKATKRIERMQRKLEDWDSGDEFGPSPDIQDKSTATNKNNRVVVLKHMFTLQQLEEDASLLLDLKEDVRDECSTLGEVTNVVLYDEEPEGIITVKFRDPISAQACVLKMQGRFFDGRRVEASLFDGKHRYRRSGANDYMDEDEGEEAEKKRLDDFAKWLLTEGD